MNYQHIYHAGNFAEVFKHCLLLALLTDFFKKDKPLTYMETHAGCGLYDLHSAAAQKNPEYHQGIEKLLTASRPPEIVSWYLSTIRALNHSLNYEGRDIRFYPGSPYLIETLRRPHDQLVFAELRESAYEELKTLFRGKAEVAIHCMDGYVALKALLPPAHRRGVVFIDPPYEKEDELAQMKEGLQQALARWPNACYVIWYPIKHNDKESLLLKSLRSLQLPLLTAHLTVSSDISATRLIGSGMAILNPPWKFRDTVRDLLPWLWKALSQNGQGEWKVA